MASPASVGGHPIHPMIIPFPIALWVFSLIADLIYLWRGKPRVERLDRILRALGRHHRRCLGSRLRHQ